MSYPISDEEYEQILRQVPTRTVTQPKEFNIDKQIENEKEQQRIKKIEARNAYLFKEQEEINKRIEQDRWTVITQGRPMPAEGEVFFTEPGELTCSICKAAVVRPLSGYNPWRGGFDVNLDYNVEDHTRHFCHSDDPNEAIVYLSKRILQLEDRVRKQRAELDDMNNLSYISLARSFKARS